MDAVGRDRLSVSEWLDGGLAKALVLRPGRVGGFNGHDLPAEAAIGPCRRRKLLRAQAKLIGAIAAYAPLLRYRFGRLKLVQEGVALEVLGRNRPAEAELLLIVGADRDPAHRFDPAGDHNVGQAAPDQACHEPKRRPR